MTLQSDWMTRLIDVSLPIGPDLLTWPGDPGIRIEPSSRLDRGDPANVSELHLGSHTGTHVDPPVHFLEGRAGVDALDLEAFFGEALVADLTTVDRIGPAELEDLRIPEDTDRLLCLTRNSELWSQRPVEFPDDYVAVTPDGAAWLVDRGIRLVGVDFLSVEKDGPPTFPVHRALLGGGVVIVEGLDLSGVEPGPYTFVCFPLRIVGGDGSPARAVLLPSSG
jgi:arylformamidase